VKSDDFRAGPRSTSHVKGEHTLEPGLPESFYVLIKELQSLCLDVELIERKNGKERLIGLEKDLVGPVSAGRLAAGKLAGINHLVGERGYAAPFRRLTVEDKRVIDNKVRMDVLSLS